MGFGREVAPIKTVCKDEFEAGHKDKLRLAKIQPQQFYVARLVMDPMILHEFAADFYVQVEEKKDPGIRPLSKKGIQTLVLSAVDIDGVKVDEAPEIEYDAQKNGDLCDTELKPHLFHGIWFNKVFIDVRFINRGYIYDEYTDGFDDPGDNAREIHPIAPYDIYCAPV